MVSLSFAISAAVAVAVVVGGAARDVVGGAAVDGAGTGAGGLGGSCVDAGGMTHAADITHHSTNTNAAAKSTLIKPRSMVALHRPPS
jgi:hypothetical protein